MRIDPASSGRRRRCVRRYPLVLHCGWCCDDSRRNSNLALSACAASEFSCPVRSSPIPAWLWTTGLDFPPSFRVQLAPSTSCRSSIATCIVFPDWNCVSNFRLSTASGQAAHLASRTESLREATSPLWILTARAHLSPPLWGGDGVRARASARVFGVLRSAPAVRAASGEHKGQGG